MNVVEYFENRSDIWSQRYHEKPAWQIRLESLIAAIGETEGSFENRHFLDFGCGAGNVAKCLAGEGCRVTAVDASEMMIQRAAEQNNNELIDYTHFCVGDDPSELETLLQARDLPLLDGAVASSVLEYVPDPLIALQSVYRVLKSDARFWFTVPSDDTPRRQIETFIQATRIHRPLKSVFGLSKLGRFMKHLNYSTNRLSQQDWSNLCLKAGFGSAKTIEVPNLRHLWLIAATVQAD